MASASESESTTRRLVDKTGTKSRVWKYFAFEADKYGAILDSNKPTCKQCLRSFQTKGGSRSNLAKHLKDRHPDCLENSIHGIKLVSRIVEIHRYWYRLLKFWYCDNPSDNHIWVSIILFPNIHIGIGTEKTSVSSAWHSWNLSPWWCFHPNWKLLYCRHNHCCHFAL